MICVGCINIEKGDFPFMSINPSSCNQPFADEFGQYYIDNEGCGETQSSYHLQIFYCPVCGKKLSSERVRLSGDMDVNT